MRLLLDSQVAVWAMSWPERLKETTRQFLISPHNEVFVSAATLWELALKVDKGKLILPDDLTATLASQHILELPVRWDHTQLISQLPALLIAQARAEGLTFVTADKLCLRYPVSLMDA